jgi:hypothetical protein
MEGKEQQDTNHKIEDDGKTGADIEITPEEEVGKLYVGPEIIYQVPCTRPKIKEIE